MQPGRRLDIKVATKVLGWKRVEDGFTFKVDGKTQKVKEVPKFSTDLNDAWILAGHLAQTYWLFELHSALDLPGFEGMPAWRCTILNADDDDGVDATAETAPHAICLAALKVV